MDDNTQYSEEIQNALTLAKSRHSKNLQFFKTYNQERFQRYYRNYRNDGQKRLREKIEPLGATWMANLFYPLTSSYVDSVVPLIVENFPTLGVKAAKSIAVEYARQINQYLQNYWVSKSGFYNKSEEFARTAAIYGVAYPILRWQVLYDIIFSYVNGNESDVSGKIENSEYLEYNDPVVENADVYNTYPDGFAPSVALRSSVSARFLLTKEEGMKRYAYLFKAGLLSGDKDANTKFEDVFGKIKAGSGDTTDYSVCRYDTLRKNPERYPVGQNGSNNATTDWKVGGDTDTSVQADNLIEFIEVHTPQDITVYTGSTYIGQVKNILKNIQIKHLPFKKPEWGIWGIGIAEELDIAQYYINVSLNQEADVASLENFPMYAYDPSGGNQMMDTDLTVSPSRMLPLPPNSISVLPRGGTLNLSYKLIEFLKVAGREATRIDETTRGSQLPSSTVATQINAIRESTNRSINGFLNIVAECEQELMKDILKLGYLLYPTVKESVEVKGEDGLTIMDDLGLPIMKEIEYIDLEIPVDEDDNEQFYKIEKEAFSPKGLYRFTPTMIKSIEFSKEASLKNSLGFLAELNRMLANPTIAKQLANLNVEPLLRDIFDKFGMRYTLPEGKESIQDIKVAEQMLTPEATQPMPPEGDMMSQLPEGEIMDMGQDLSTINQ